MKEENEIIIKLEEYSDDEVDLSDGNSFGINVNEELSTIHDQNTVEEREIKIKVESFDENALKAEVKIIDGQNEKNQDLCNEPLDEIFVYGKIRGVNSTVAADRTHMKNDQLQSCVKIRRGKKVLYKCRICNKSFLRNSNFQRHIRVHTGEKPFKCNECHKAFIDHSALKYHLRIHTGEKPFKCNECDKAFAVSSNLQRHMRVHTGEKPFKCNACDKAFTDHSSLKYHLRIHTGEKPFKCNQCDKAFAVSSNLQRHMKVHIAEKPF